MKQKPLFLTFLAIVTVCSTSDSAIAANRKPPESDKTAGPPASMSSDGAKSTTGKTDKSKKDSKAEEKSTESAAEEKERLSAKVMDPARFAGLAQIGYAAAKASPVIMSKIFCYCGCDITDSHSSLLDCFTSIHGVDCHICQEEAVLALKLTRDNVSDAEIQKTIDEKYSDKYPFEEDSPTYKKYKANKLYGAKPADSGAASSKASDAKFGDGTAGPEAPKEEKKWVPVLKPGKQAPKCCAGKHKDEPNDEHKKQPAEPAKKPAVK